MTVRLSTESAHTFYGGYSVNGWLGFIGIVQNQGTGYRETIVGVGRTVSRGAQSVLLGAAGARASDAPYLQLYVLPNVRVGRFQLNGTIESYHPVDGTGTLQLGTAPLNVYWLASSRAALGATYVLSAARGAASGHALGSSLRLGIPRGTVTVDLLRGLTAAPTEIRLTMFSSF